MMSDDAATALRRAMCLTMLADGRIARRETDLIVARWSELSGRPFEPAAFEAEAAAIQADAKASWASLAPLAGALTEAEKAAILRAAVHMLIADGEFCEEELQALHRIARILGVKDIKRLMNEAWRESRAE
jgi:tellurite resistance protein